MLLLDSQNCSLVCPENQPTNWFSSARTVDISMNTFMDDVGKTNVP